MSYLPIVYVRGYAGSQGEVEQTVDDPFYGFNLGSTHIRQDQTGDPEMYFFESPLLRLIADHGYSEVFNGYAQEVRDTCPNAARTLWIYRYYDVTSKTYKNPDPKRLTVESAATELLQFIDETVLPNVANWCAKQSKPTPSPTRVILVAHSMGGLVCRSLIEKILPEKQRKASDVVDRLFTFGTPHGGIHFEVFGGGLLERVRDLLGVNESDSFGHKRMSQYLQPQGQARPQFDPQEIGDESNFSPDRIFCAVGTNSRDYDAVFGLSRKAVGPQSDGLVQIDRAYVRKSHRAYIHRSHSGRYGMVNSEEGYLNLERFLFGDLKIKAVLCDFTLDFADGKAKRTYFVEMRVAIRGLPVSMHERALDQLCAVPLDKDQYSEQMTKGGLPLFTAFLRKAASVDLLDNTAAAQPTMQYMIRIALHRQDEHKGLLPWAKQMSRLPIWTDYVIVQLVPGRNGKYQASYRWLSSGADSDFIDMEESVKDGQTILTAALPKVGRQSLGKDAALRFFTSPWG